MIDSIRLLLVDVDGDERSAAVDALDGPDRRVRAAATADEALDVVETEPVDCVASRYDLPETDGIALLREVHDRNPELPFVLYAVDGSEALASRAVAEGAAGYVPADAGHDVLDRRVRDALETVAGPETRAAVDAGAGSRPTTAVTRLQQRLSLLKEQSPLAIVEWNEDFEITDWNPKATELFGYGTDEAIGERVTDLIVPDHEQDDVERVLSSLAHTDGAFQHVNENVTKSGDRLVCEWNNSPLTVEGEVTGGVGMVRDVTDEVRRIETLETLQEVTRSLMRLGSKEAVAREVIDAARDVVDQPIVSIRLYDEDRGVLEPVAMTPRTREILDDVGDVVPVGPGDGLLWDAFEADEAMVYPEFPVERTCHGDALPRGSGMLHPLGDHGLLLIGNVERDAFDETDVHLASVVASTTEAALDRSARERELERHKAITERVGHGVFALDREGHYTMVNDTVVESTGYSRDELVGAHASTVLAEEDVTRGQQYFRELLAGERSVVTYEVTVQTADGDTLPCEASLTLLDPGPGSDGTVVGTIRDITDRKAIEATLRDHQRKVESLHDVASRLENCNHEDGIYEVAVEAAKGVLEFDLCSVSIVEGENFANRAMSADDMPEDPQTSLPVDEGFAGEAYQSGEPNVVDDVREQDDWSYDGFADFRSMLTVPIGEYGVFQVYSREVGAFGEADLDLAELLGAHVSDAIGRVRFETQLREERDRFAALFENVPDPVVAASYGPEGPVVRDVNAAFEQVFGFDDEIVGENLDDFIVPEDKRTEAERLNERGVEGRVFEAEVRRRTATGLRDFLVTHVPVDVEQQHPLCYVVYTDITERKQRQKRVEVLNRVLRHDLRNGMNIVKGSAEMLRDLYEDETAKQYTDVIVDRADELAALAEKTRAVERTLDRGVHATGPIDVVTCVEQSVRQLKAEYPEAEVDLALPESAPASADELLSTAIYHVLENALVHNDRPTPRVEVEVGPVDSDVDMIQIAVADNGPGIPREERELLTEEKEITQLRHASGLGLWLVDWVVTQCGGQLRFSENEPRGSVVQMHLPLAKQESPPTDPA